MYAFHTPRWRAFRLWLPLLAAALSALLLTGCRTQTADESRFAALAPPGPSAPAVSRFNTNYLSEGDLLSITFQYSTNFNTTQKVSLDGTINLESVGLVKAAGLTAIELQECLARLYKPQIKDDLVTVRVLAAAYSVYVSGAVLRPGKVPLERPMTVLEAIMEAGGFDSYRARLSRVSVLRIEHGQHRIFHIDLRKVIDGQDTEPFYLKPFDIVHVPQKTFNF